MAREARRGRGGRRGRGRSRGSRSAEPGTGSGNRGQTNALAIVLLVGIVAVGSVGVVVLGSIALDTQRAAVETEHARQSMFEFAHTAETVTYDTGEPAAVAFRTFDHGRVETRTDGHVRVVDATDSEVLHEESLGSLVYVAGDTEIAYQGGGLWRNDGGATVSLSPPPVEFRNGRVQLSVVHLTGDETRRDSFDGTVRRTAPPTSLALGESEPNDRPSAGRTVRVEIASEYCDGWERELEETNAGRVVERCADGRANRLRYELEISPRIDGIDGTVVADEIDIHESAPPIEGDVRTGSVDEEKVNGTVYDDGYDYASVDDQIDAAVAECDGAFEELNGTISEPGVHCTDELTGAHEFDTAAGDITVVVRDSIGDPNYQDDLRVEGENAVTILTAGDLHARGDAAVGNESDPSRLRLLFSSDSEVTTAKGGPTISALIYAPDSAVSFQGNPTLEGSVVGDRVEIGNINPGAVSYHESIDDVAFRPGTGPQLRSVDVTAHELAIDE